MNKNDGRSKGQAVYAGRLSAGEKNTVRVEPAAVDIGKKDNASI